MLDKPLKEVNTFPIDVDEVRGCRDSVLFTHRALGTGLALLEMTDAEFHEAMCDPERFVVICQIFKLLFIDKGYAEFQTEMREMAIERIAHGFVAVQHPDTKAMLMSPVEFEVLPDAPGISAGAVNRLRPALVWSLH